MRIVRDERGATAVIFAIMLTVLFGMGALVIDVGSAYHQRRVLQNGADAAALAVAQDCATSQSQCSSYVTTAGGYTTQNSPDAYNSVVSPATPCGLDGFNILPACSPVPSGVPSGTYYDEVKTSRPVNYVFGPLLGISSKTVEAHTVVAWGAPSSLTATLPLALSYCGWALAAQNSSSYVTTTQTKTLSDLNPTYESFMDSKGQNIVNSTEETNCTNPNGSGAAVDGGFNWLQSTDYTTSTGTWYQSNTGAAVPVTMPAAGQIIFLPVFTDTCGSGSTTTCPWASSSSSGGTNSGYLITQYAAFFLTGYWFPGGSNRQASIVPGDPNHWCYQAIPGGTASDSCISGYFVSDATYTGSSTVSGPPTGGVTVYQVIQ